MSVITRPIAGLSAPATWVPLTVWSGVGIFTLDSFVCPLSWCLVFLARSISSSRKSTPFLTAALIIRSNERAKVA